MLKAILLATLVSSSLLAMVPASADPSSADCRYAHHVFNQARNADSGSSGQYWVKQQIQDCASRS